MDIGGHRFVSKVPEVNEWWNNMLPLQGSPTYDDIVLHREMTLTPGGPDPEKEDRVMLRRNRVSRIYFKRKFFDYPISLKPETFANMGLLTTLEVGFSYLFSLVHKRKEHSLEDFYINRFGKKLYSMFFEHYTENLWGRHPSEIAPDWGAQRVKGLSIIAIIKDMFSKMIPGRENQAVETSLIEEFSYPKLGPGQLWDVTADEIRKMGGTILTGCLVTNLHKDTDNRITSLTYVHEGSPVTVEGDLFISSMPVKDLVAGMNDVPKRPAQIAAGLPYRDYMTVGLLFIMYGIYFRIAPGYGYVLILTPAAFFLNIPYALPLTLGLTGGPVCAVPMAFGIIVYNLMYYMKNNTTMLSSSDTEQMISRLTYLVENVLNNKNVILTILVFALTLMIVYAVRRMNVDYAWYFAIGTGAVANVVLFLLGALVMEVDVPIGPLMLETLAAVGIALIVEFFAFNVDYSRTEYTQFEDDEYYYYVKAVPKMSIAVPEKKVKKINSRHKNNRRRH